MTKILITDETKKKAKTEKDKLNGKEISKLSKAQLDALITVICQMLGIADIDGLIK